MKKYYFISIVLISAICFLSCHKNDVNSNGMGVNKNMSVKIGANILYSGNTEPTSNTGTIGDLYLNTSNGNFYTSKTSMGWGTPIALRDTGTTKTTTAQTLLVGSGVPNTSVGKPGDFYIDTIMHILYGPKATDWNGNLVPLITDMSSQHNFILANGFDNIRLDSSVREFNVKYFYNFTNTSAFIFNQDDSIRRSKYKYYNYASIPSNYFSNIGINQIAARGMNVTVLPRDLATDPRLTFAKIGQPFKFIADSLNNSFIFTNEDSIRMVSSSYPDPLLWKPVDPTMKVGEKIRFGNLANKADSLNIFDNVYSSSSNIALRSIVPNYDQIKSTYQIYFFIKTISSYKSDSLSDTWKGGTINSNSYFYTIGRINDSTQFRTTASINNDSIRLNSNLFSFKMNIGPGFNVDPTAPTETKIPYAPSDTTYQYATYGGRPSTYNANEFRNGTFYQIKIIIVPPGH